MEPTGEGKPAPRPMMGLRRFVRAAGFITGGSFGFLTALLYGFTDSSDTNETLLAGLGVLVGCVSGLVAGSLWCRLMFLKARELMQSRKGNWPIVILLGIGWGLVVGVASAGCVHVAIWILMLHVSIEGLLVALMFGAPSGAIVGLICGTLCAESAWLAVRRAEG
jgi:hypothetical protein